MNIMARVERSLKARWRRLVSRWDHAVHSKPAVYTVRYNDVTGPYQLCMRLADGGGMRARLHGGTEMPERRIFLPLIRKGSVCCDVGAHVGDYTVEMALMVGEGGRVYAFEAIPHYVKLLSETLRANRLASNVVLKLAAVGAAPGTLSLPSEMLTGSLGCPGRLGEDSPKEDVPVVRLDDEIPTLDVIKIDCEGYEVKVLQGMRRLLQSNDGLLVFLEVHNRQLPEAGNSLRELAELLLVEQSLAVYQISKKHCLCIREGLPGDRYRRVETVPQFLEVFHKT